MKVKLSLFLLYFRRTSSLGSFQLIGSFESCHNSSSPPQDSSSNSGSEKRKSMDDGNSSNSPSERSPEVNLNDNRIKDFSIGQEENLNDSRVKGCSEGQEEDLNDIRVRHCSEGQILNDMEETLTKQNSGHNIFDSSNQEVISEDLLKEPVLDNYLNLQNAFVDSVNVVDDDIGYLNERDRSSTVVNQTE